MNPLTPKQPQSKPKLSMPHRYISSMAAVVISVLPKVFALCVGLVVHEHYRCITPQVSRLRRLPSRCNSRIGTRPIRTVDRATSARYCFLIPPRKLAEPFLLQIPTKRVALSVGVSWSLIFSRLICWCATKRLIVTSRFPQVIVPLCDDVSGLGAQIFRCFSSPSLRIVCDC